MEGDTYLCLSEPHAPQEVEVTTCDGVDAPPSPVDCSAGALNAPVGELLVPHDDLLTTAVDVGGQAVQRVYIVHQTSEGMVIQIAESGQQAAPPVGVEESDHAYTTRRAPVDAAPPPAKSPLAKTPPADTQETAMEERDQQVAPPDEAQTAPADAAVAVATGAELVDGGCDGGCDGGEGAEGEAAEGVALSADPICGEFEGEEREDEKEVLAEVAATAGEDTDNDDAGNSVVAPGAIAASNGGESTAEPTADLTRSSEQSRSSDQSQSSGDGESPPQRTMTRLRARPKEQSRPVPQIDSFEATIDSSPTAKILKTNVDMWGFEEEEESDGETKHEVVSREKQPTKKEDSDALWDAALRKKPATSPSDAVTGGASAGSSSAPRLPQVNSDMKSLQAAARSQKVSPPERRIGINWKGMRFSVHRGETLPQPAATSSSPQRRRTTAVELRRREAAVERREAQLRALDSELDMRASTVRSREARLARMTAQLRARELALETREKRLLCGELNAASRDRRQARKDAMDAAAAVTVLKTPPKTEQKAVDADSTVTTTAVSKAAPHVAHVVPTTRPRSSRIRVRKRRVSDDSDEGPLKPRAVKHKEPNESETSESVAKKAAAAAKVTPKSVKRKASDDYSSARTSGASAIAAKISRRNSRGTGAARETANVNEEKKEVKSVTPKTSARRETSAVAETPVSRKRSSGGSGNAKNSVRTNKAKQSLLVKKVVSEKAKLSIKKSRQVKSQKVSAGSVFTLWLPMHQKDNRCYEWESLLMKSFASFLQITALYINCIATKPL